MKTYIKIFVTDDDVINNFALCRPDCIDEETAQEKSDDYEMTSNDIEIAIIQKSNIRYSLFTSCNRWNLYIAKDKWINKRNPEPNCKEIKYWETFDIQNITGDSDEWDSLTDLVHYLLNLNFNN